VIPAGPLCSVIASAPALASVEASIAICKIVGRSLESRMIRPLAVAILAPCIALAGASLAQAAASTTGQKAPPAASAKKPCDSHAKDAKCKPTVKPAASTASKPAPPPPKPRESESGYQSAGVAS